MTERPAGFYAAAAETTPETRVVTHEGRRTSVRLEPVFWRALTRMARMDGVRVGNLIGRIAQGYGGRNLTAHLRALCMLDAERRLASAPEGAGGEAILPVVRWAPTPALLLGADAEILEENAAFDVWLEAPKVRGLYLGEAFRIRAARPFRELWRSVQESGRPVGGIGLLRISQGRVTAAEGTIVPFGPPAGGAGTPAVVWISARGSRGRQEPRGGPRAHPSTSTSEVSGG